MKVDSSARTQKVVVVGGSFAGLCAIRHLKQYENLQITLIEPKNYFEYTPGALHLLAGSKSDLISSISDITKDSAKVIHGKFFGLSGSADSKSIIVKLIDVNGETSALSEVPYDAIIICTGVPYTAPIRNSAVLGPTLENRLLEIDDYNKRLRSASRVIISGGGLVGVELAAEVSVRLEKQVKEVLLISRSTLLGTLPEEAGRLALNWLKKRKNVKVYLNDEIVGAPFQDGSNSSPSSSSVGRGDEPGTTMTYRTLKGELLKGDMFIDCTGQYAKASGPTANDYKIATSASSDIDSTVSKDFVWPYNSNGMIAVDAHLMATKYPSSGMFAAGDVVEHFPGVGFASTTLKSGLFGRLSTSPSVRNAHLAESQAELCAANVATYLSLSPSSASRGMLKYPQGIFGVPEVPLLACVSLGPMHGIVVFNDLVLGGVLFGMIGGLVKYIVERSKLAEIRNKTWGRALWAFGHIVVNAMHVLHVRFRSLFRSFFGIFRGDSDKEKKMQKSFL